MKGTLYRELLRIFNRKRLLLAPLAVPLFALLFMATIFGNGTIEELPVGIVDNSASPYSRQIILTAQASPTLKISTGHIFSNESQAREAMQKMEIYGYLVIPSDFSSSLMEGNQPTITGVYHNAMLAAGGEVKAAFVKVIGDFSTSLIASQGNLAGISPIEVETIAMPTNGIFSSTYNTSLNYGTFLAYPFFFIFFQIFILTFTVYIIGTDLSPQWLTATQKKSTIRTIGNLYGSLAGKLLPYACIFLAQTLLANWVFFTVAHTPYQGSLLAIVLNSILFIGATMALGIAIISIIPKVSIAISIASMIGALGATASGVTFPVENMYPAFQALCSIFPVRHFILGYQASVYLNAPFALTWHTYALLLLAIPLCLCAAPLLRRAVKDGRAKPLPVMWGTSLVILGGTVGYCILYGLLYHPNIVTEVPVAVIDNSQTPASREYLRNLDATQQVHAAYICQDLPQAQSLMQQNIVKGIVTIPASFASRISQGAEAPFAVIQTTTSFLYYLTIQTGIASTMQQANNTLRQSTVQVLPLSQQLLLSQTPTVQYDDVTVYNHNGGYGSYLLPIALIIIIFQTMLMSGGILAGGRSISPLKFIPMLAGGYFLLSLFIVGLVPELFSLPALANRWELALFMALFILTTAAFTGAVTPLFKDPEEVMLYVPFFSVGLIFLSGSSYPINGIPHFWQIVHYVFPTSPGILGYLKLNSMEGSLQHIIPQTATLLAQLLIYGSVFTLYLRKPGKRNNL